MSTRQPQGTDQLRTRVLPYGRQLLADYPRIGSVRSPEDIVGDGLVALIDRQQSQVIERPVAYLKKIMLHNVMRLSKALSAEDRTAALNHTEIVTQPEPQESGAHPDIWREAARLGSAMRQSLSRIPDPTSRERVHFPAVLGLALRTAKWTTTRRLCQQHELAWSSKQITRFVEAMSPWKTSWVSAPLRAGLPSAGTVWASVVATDEWPTNNHPAALCSLINTLTEDGAFNLTVATWYQWIKRAKNRARRGIDDQEWARYFARWFPDHRTTGEE